MRPVLPHEPAGAPLVALELAAIVLCGCLRHHAVATVDASAAPPDASAGRGSHARRHRHGRAIARSVATGAYGGGTTPSATTTTLGDPGRSSADDFALGGASDDDEQGPDPAPRQRARITETGPVLPEALGHATGTTLDMTGTTTGGTMGLEPAQISHAMDPLMGRLSRCADATSDDRGHGPHGRVGVRLRIHASGAPVAAQVTGGGGSAEFVTCVRRVVASARFAAFSGPDVFASWGFDVD